MNSFDPFLEGEDGAYDDVELYQKLTSLVRDL